MSESLIVHKELYKSKSHCEGYYAMNVSLVIKNKIQLIREETS